MNLELPDGKAVVERKGEVEVTDKLDFQEDLDNKLEVIDAESKCENREVEVDTLDVSSEDLDDKPGGMELEEVEKVFVIVTTAETDDNVAPEVLVVGEDGPAEAELSIQESNELEDMSIDDDSTLYDVWILEPNVGMLSKLVVVEVASSVALLNSSAVVVVKVFEPQRALYFQK